MGNGDCILLENYDKEGKKRYGLIDAGQNTFQSFNMTKFLQNHGINFGDKLDFFLITHCHGDHVGIPDKNGKIKAEYILERYKIGTLYMKEFDESYSSGGVQEKYEAIIKKAIEKNINVVGVSPQSLVNKNISPKLSLKLNSDEIMQIKSNFKSFNQNNLNFSFGSASIKLINWQMYYKDGTEYKSGTVPTKKRLKIANENSNSLGVLLTQGTKKAFFGGDLNNNKDSANLQGPEDRVKNEIGEVDLLKLNHHGKEGSNTESFINVLNPKMVIVSTEIGKIDKDAGNWLNNHKNVKCLYTPLDSDCVSATIEKDNVYLGFYDTNCFKEINGEMYYIPEKEQYSDFTKEGYGLNYLADDKVYSTVNASNFKELKEIIENDKKIEINQNNKYYMDEKMKKINIKPLLIKLSGTKNDWKANESIKIQENQNIIIINENKDTTITITRDSNLIELPLFEVKGMLSIGKEKMNGNIIIDGKKIEAASPLINVEKGTLKIYNNVTLCNNVNKVSAKYLKKDKDGNVLPVYSTSYTSDYSAFGSGIYCNFGTIEINGGIIKENKEVIDLKYTLPEIIGKYYHFNALGAGIYLENHSKLTIRNGQVINNTAINNSIVQTMTKKSTTTSSANRGMTQSIYGVGIYAQNSEVNLFGGKIFENEAENNSKTILNNPENGKTSIYSMNNGIYGVGIYIESSKLNIANNLKISTNNASLEAQINSGSNVEITKHLISSIRGAQGYISNTTLSIDGLEVNGVGSEISNKTSVNKGKTSKKLNEDLTNHGEGLMIKKCDNMRIKNIDIHDCKSKNIIKGGAVFINSCNDGNIYNASFKNNTVSDSGGGIYIDSSKIKITDAIFIKNKGNKGTGGAACIVSSKVEINKSKFKGNSAKYGGGIYSNSSITKLNNVTLSENKSNKSGGALYSINKEMLISGKNTEIINNSAGTFGGGIAINNSKVVYENGSIKGNKAKSFGNGVGIYSGSFDKKGGIIKDNVKKK